MIRGGLIAWAFALGVVSALAAQAPAREDGRAPVQFLALLDRGTKPVPVEASQVAALRRKVSVHFNGATLEQALVELGRAARLTFAYSKADVPLGQRVTLRAESMTVAAVLTELLIDAGVDVVVTRDDRLVLMSRRDGVAAARQNGSITGRVTDAKTGRSVRGAEVFLVNTRWRITTDTIGQYHLAEVTSGSYTLAVRRLGYAKQERQVSVRDGQEDTVDVALEPRATRLDELVTTATGPRRRLDLANDVTLLNADSIVRTEPVSSVTDLLEARVPGLTVQRTSGAPGDPARLRLRGTSSPLRNNDPIVFVDGVRVYAEQSATRGANLASRDVGFSEVGNFEQRNYATPSPLDYIDPNSIETIEVVKGPSAATLYGQDAANGVIVITTKKGKAGPTHWTMTADRGQKKLAGKYPELVFRWGHVFHNNIPINCPITNRYGASVFDPGSLCIGDSLVPFQLLNDPDLTVLDKGRNTALTLGASGGSSALTYAVTGSYGDAVGLIKLPAYEMDRYQSLLGIAPPDWMQRPQHLTQWAATSSVTARLGTQADLTLQANLSRTEQQRSSLEQQLGTLMSTYLDRASGKYYRGDASTPVDNALDNYYQRAADNATQITTSANLSYRPRTWLAFTADAGINLVQRADQIFFPRGPSNSFYASNDTTGYVSDAQGRSILSTVRARANVTAPLRAGFVFRFAAGADYANTSTNDVAAGTSDLAPGSSLQGAVNRFIRRGETSDVTFGWYGEPSIGNSRFNFTSGLRLDGGNSYGSSASGLSLPKFPKLGFSYLISDEPFFPFKDLVPVLKLRVAYGKASRQPGATDRLRLYTTPTQMFVNGQLQTVLALATLGNTDVRPEQTTELEGGFDADLLDNRLHVSMTGYRKTTDDALLDVPVAPSVYGTGTFSSVKIAKNIGVTRNTGVELEVTTEWLRSQPVQWSTQVQFRTNRNIVVELGPNVDPLFTSGADQNGGGIRLAAGYPLNGRWTRPIIGYADVNGNGILERDEIQLGDTAVYVGATEPNYGLNLHTTLSLWHSVFVTAGFAYEDGLSQRNETALQLAPFSRGRQDPTASLAEQLAVTSLDYRIGEAGLATSDYNWIQTVNTMRFNSLSVRYAVPSAVARRLGAQTLSIAVQGTNLALWTNYRGLDPNVNAFSTGNNVSDAGILPEPRTWQLRVNATY